MQEVERDANRNALHRLRKFKFRFRNDNVFKKSLEMKEQEFDDVKEHAKKELHELMAKSISVVLNRFPVIDNIILVTDGGSWRKQLPVPEVIENVTYKGNRTTAKELDWKYIYGALTELSEQCKNLGVTVSNHSSIEGDDWIWYWSRRLNAEGTSCIIWSSDNDLKQLVQTDNNTLAFTAWYNDRNGVWFDMSNKQEFEDDLDYLEDYVGALIIIRYYEILISSIFQLSILSLSLFLYLLLFLF